MMIKELYLRHPQQVPQVVRFEANSISFYKYQSRIPQAPFKADFPRQCRMRCSYEAIMEAISSWGKVEAILETNYNHAFIIRFNKPVKITKWEPFRRFEEQHRHYINEATGFIFNSGFFLRGSLNHRNILSENMMVCGIDHLDYGPFYDTKPAQEFLDAIRRVGLSFIRNGFQVLDQEDLVSTRLMKFLKII